MSRIRPGEEPGDKTWWFLALACRDDPLGCPVAHLVARLHTSEGAFRGCYRGTGRNDEKAAGGRGHEA